MADVTTKRCSLCKLDLPAADFNRAARARTGLTSRCRRCDSEYKKQHRAKHAERYRAAAAARYVRDKEKIRAYYKEWRERPGVREDQRLKMLSRYWADPDATRARSRAYRRVNKERVKAWRAAEYQRNGEAIRARMRRTYEADRERWKAAVLVWARANPDLVNERNRRYRARRVNAAIGKVTPELLAAKLTYWGHRCWICRADPDTWDHVKPLSRGGPHMLANLRPACWSCNSSKSNRWPFALAGVG